MDTIEDIYWDDTILLFKSLNSLYFILFEKHKRKHNTKKFIYEKEI